MDRRRFLVTSLAGALIPPLAAEAQQAGKVSRVGYLRSTRPVPGDPSEEAFREGLRERGWAEGQNLVIEYRFSDGRNERFPALAAELVQMNVDLIVAGNTQAALAAKQATTTMPIVFSFVGDPVGSGIVASLARPGGNLTGLGGLFSGMHVKMLELLKEAVPTASRVAVVWNSTLSFHTNHIDELQGAAQKLGIQTERVDVRSPDDLDQAFAAMARRRPQAVLVLGQPLISTHAARVAKLAAEHRLPAMYVFEVVVAAGGLMSYGSRNIDGMRRLPYYIDRVLRGAKPADLPVEQPDRFYLTINLKTAKALGLTIPQSLLLRADQIIE
jgi:putative ABC transport system substrate-binding protein